MVAGWKLTDWFVPAPCGMETLTIVALPLLTVLIVVGVVEEDDTGPPGLVRRK